MWGSDWILTSPVLQHDSNPWVRRGLWMAVSDVYRCISMQGHDNNVQTPCGNASPFWIWKKNIFIRYLNAEPVRCMPVRKSPCMCVVYNYTSYFYKAYYSGFSIIRCHMHQITAQREIVEVVWGMHVRDVYNNMQLLLLRHLMKCFFRHYVF